jgi:hypothetical protein
MRVVERLPMAFGYSFPTGELMGLAERRAALVIAVGCLTVNT